MTGQHGQMMDVNASMPDYTERIKLFDKLKAKDLIRERSQEDIKVSEIGGNISPSRSVKKLRKVGKYNYTTT